MKKALLITLFAATSNSFAATALVSNVVAGPGDTLYADSSGSLLSSGIVTVGYFGSGFDVNANLADQGSLVGSFTSVTSQQFGQSVTDLGGGIFAGYVQGTIDAIGNITTGNALLGRALYSFIGNAATLAGSTEVALVLLQNIGDDVPTEQAYSGNPAGLTPTIGTIGSFMGDASGSGSATHPTVQTAVLVPEPSTLLLSAFGVLGLLRRKR